MELFSHHLEDFEEETPPKCNSLSKLMKLITPKLKMCTWYDYHVMFILCDSKAENVYLALYRTCLPTLAVEQSKMNVSA